MYVTDDDDDQDGDDDDEGGGIKSQLLCNYRQHMQIWANLNDKCWMCVHGSTTYKSVKRKLNYSVSCCLRGIERNFFQLRLASQPEV